jgi:hypothetical protein
MKQKIKVGDYVRRLSEYGANAWVMAINLLR